MICFSNDNDLRFHKSKVGPLQKVMTNCGYRIDGILPGSYMWQRYFSAWSPKVCRTRRGRARSPPERRSNRCRSEESFSNDRRLPTSRQGTFWQLTYFEIFLAFYLILIFLELFFHLKLKRKTSVQVVYISWQKIKINK